MRHLTRVVVVGLAAVCGPALAMTAAAAAPPQDVFDKNDNAWTCEEEGGLPPAHCLNVKSQGNTGVIKVFLPDERWPQESISFDPKSDTRPCPHDLDADADGTWWSPSGGAFWVCHHRP